MIEVKIKRLSEKAVLPKKAFPTDGGYDMYATSIEFDDYGNIVYGLGWAFEIPEGYVGLLFPRSSTSKFDINMQNSIGLIDCHFRGEVKAKYRPTSTQPVRGAKTNCIEVYQSNSADIYEVGDKVAQMVFIKLPETELKEVEELSKTDRGEGGWGHTGRK